MKATTLIAALLLTLAMPAAAQLGKVNTRAYEASLSTLRLPQSDAGSVGFRACEACEYQTRLVAANVLYKINNERVKLVDLRSRMSELRQQDNSSATIVHDLATDRITEVAIWVFE